MYNIVELEKIFDITSSNFSPHTAYVYQSRVTFPTIADFWSTVFGADDLTNKTNQNITSVRFDFLVGHVQMDTLQDSLDVEGSFYFDTDAQVLYVHAFHDMNPYSSTVSGGNLYGFTDDTVRYFKNILYQPLVTSIPSISQQADPLQYGVIAFSGGSVEFSNNGFFDDIEPLYGNLVRLKRGEEGDTFEDLTHVFTGYIKDYTLSTDSFRVEAGDKRERLQVEYPLDETTILESYDEDALEWITDAIIEPDGYGDVVQVPAYPVTENVDTMTMKWGMAVTSITQVYTFHDSVLEAVSHSAFSTDGTFEIAQADIATDGADMKKGLKDVYVTGRMRDMSNPGDIIKDLNSRVAGIEYNSTNYDQTEWTTESAQLADVALYLDDTQRLYEWIEKLQGGSDYGFRYEDLDRITMRIDDPNRTEAHTIEPIQIRNADIPIRQNAELFATSTIVKWGKNHRNDKFSRVENTDYEADAIEEFRIKRQRIEESLLTTELNANSKADILAHDVHTVRPIVTVRLDAKEFPDVRIYDTVNATISLLEPIKHIPRLWSYAIGSVDIAIGDVIVIGDVHELTRTEAYEYDSPVREYYGEGRFQVIGIRFATDTNEVTLELRQRDTME